MRHVIVLVSILFVSGCDRGIGLNATVTRDPDSATGLDLLNGDRAGGSLNIVGSPVNAPIYFHSPAPPANPAPAAEPLPVPVATPPAPAVDELPVPEPTPPTPAAEPALEPVLPVSFVSWQAAPNQPDAAAFARLTSRYAGWIAARRAQPVNPTNTRMVLWGYGKPGKTRVEWLDLSASPQTWEPASVPGVAVAHVTRDWQVVGSGAAPAAAAKTIRYHVVRDAPQRPDQWMIYGFSADGGFPVSASNQPINGYRIVAVVVDDTVLWQE